MGTHGSGKRLPAHRPPPPAAPASASSPSPLEHAARELLEVLHRMPWTRDHRPECPASSAGPCTCGSEALGAAIGALGERLGT